MWGAWVRSLPPELTATSEQGIRRPRWIEETFDCDTISLGMLVHAQTSNALANEKCGVAVGVIAYKDGTQGNHALLWYVDKTQAVRFFEPQTGNSRDLTIAERSSSWFGLAS